jgi:DNA-binding response OmpR family regulator
MHEHKWPDCGSVGRKSVLVIDDDPLILDVSTLILEQAGFKVLVANEPHLGIERFRENAAWLDAVILDLAMPKFDGEKVLAELRRIRADVPVILTSGYLLEEVHRRFVGSALTRFMPKPYRPNELIAAVRAALKSVHRETPPGGTVNRT